jgi:hypothetical protein
VGFQISVAGKLFGAGCYQTIASYCGCEVYFERIYLGDVWFKSDRNSDARAQGLGTYHVDHQVGIGFKQKPVVQFEDVGTNPPIPRRILTEVEMPVC